MVDFPADYNGLVTTLKEEWNLAEEAIKFAENTCGEVVQPSINELRYAGRRLIDALHAKNECKPDSDVNAYLRDAIFDCHRARHDAVDAGSAKIVVGLDIAVEKLSNDVVLKAFPDFADLRGRVGVVRDQLAISRRHRQDRDKIYNSIMAEDFPEISKRYERFRCADPLMRAMAKRERQKQFFQWIGWLIALIVAIVAWVFPVK